MATERRTFDFAKALSGISSKDDHVRNTCVCHGTSDDEPFTFSRENFFNLDDYMDRAKFVRMSGRAEQFFNKLDKQKKSSAPLNADDKATSSKENQGSSNTSEEDEIDSGGWTVSQLPSHQYIHFSKAFGRLTDEERKEFKSLPSSVVADLQKEVVEYRQKYMEMCTQHYSELYKPTEDCPDISVEMVVQYLVQFLVQRLEDEDWEDMFEEIADPYEESEFWTMLHAVQALAVHFNVCTKNQAKNIVVLLNLPFVMTNKFQEELLHAVVCWIVDPTFGPVLAEAIGEVVLEGGDYIYENLVEPITEHICPQQKPLVKYKKVRDILVFYLCAELAKSEITSNNCQVINCLVKLDGHESWALVEDVYTEGRYDWTFDRYTYVDFLEDLNLGTCTSLHENALQLARRDSSQLSEARKKYWKDYDKRCSRLETRHRENLKDPSYCDMHHHKSEDSKRMYLEVCKFLQKNHEEGRRKKLVEHSGIPFSVTEAIQKWQNGGRNGKVAGKDSKDSKEKNVISSNVMKKSEKSGGSASKTCPGKVPLNLKKCKIRECGFCGKLSSPELKFSKCGSCLQVYYCSRDCQKQHWKAGHRNQCNKNSK